MKRTAVVAVTGILASLVTGCGASSPGSNGASAAAGEPATVPGLTAAVLSHLEDRRVEPRGESSNPDEGWRAVDVEVQAAGGAVPVSVMVVEAGEELDLSEVDTCPTPGSTVLGCRVEHAVDGSPVVAQTSTEDIVGGISPDGLFVLVSHARKDHLVLVVEELRSRTQDDRAMRGLPVDLDVLVDIATDPAIGPAGR